jgi:hypothetical protein
MKKIWVFLLPLSMCLAAATCKQSSSGSTDGTIAKSDANCVEKQGDGCMCAEIYKPVCGCNGCSAKCQGITKYTEGECPKGK